jgi:hypothetical protein
MKTLIDAGYDKSPDRLRQSPVDHRRRRKAIGSRGTRHRQAVGHIMQAPSRALLQLHALTSPSTAAHTDQRGAGGLSVRGGDAGIQ